MFKKNEMRDSENRNTVKCKIGLLQWRRLLSNLFVYNAGWAYFCLISTKN